jgi:hypothetical protein
MWGYALSNLTLTPDFIMPFHSIHCAALGLSCETLLWQSEVISLIPISTLV